VPAECASADATCVQYPVLWDVLGSPGETQQVQVAPVYFNRPDVKAAIHAPAGAMWSECVPSDFNVFATSDGFDASPPSSLAALPRAIERSQRTVIMHGLADFLLQAPGTRAVIQKYVSTRLWRVRAG
jgi:carboxypeptidase D